MVTSRQRNYLHPIPLYFIKAIYWGVPLPFLTLWCYSYYKKSLKKICERRLFAKIYSYIFLRLGNIGFQCGSSKKKKTQQIKSYMMNRKIKIFVREIQSMISGLKHRKKGQWQEDQNWSIRMYIVCTSRHSFFSNNSDQCHIIEGT